MPETQGFPLSYDLSPAMLEIMTDAANCAAVTGAGSADLVHVMLAMIDVAAVKDSLRARGVNPADLRELLFGALDGRAPEPPLSKPMDLSPLVMDVMGRSFEIDGSCMPETMIEVISRLDRGGGGDDWIAVEMLRSLERAASRPDDGFGTGLAASSPSPGRGDGEPPRGPALPEGIEAWCTDLTERARQGGLDPVYGREKELGRLVEILRRRRKNNPVLLGEPGVGKTALVEGLAALIAEGSALPGTTLLSLDVMRLVGGTRNRGDLEERLRGIVEAVSSDRRFILFVDEIHAIAGGISGAADAANLLKPALASGALRCIGATTWSEYGKYVEQDPALSRRFLPVHVGEPSREASVDLLEKLVPLYRDHHGVGYADGTASAAVDLTVRHVHGRFLPDKAIDVIDEAGSLAAERGLDEVDLAVIGEVVSGMCGVDVTEGGGTLRAAAERLAVSGSFPAAAVKALGRGLARAEAALSGERATRASFLFPGPDGSGRKALAAALARELRLPLTTLDMRGYREPHTLSRLVGSPPGYVGFGQGGHLTETLRRSPASVLLVERLDLACPEVAEVVLAALSGGKASDAAGREVSLAGTVVVVTCADVRRTSPIGFSAAGGGERQEGIPEALAAFAETADAVVPFRAMDRDALASIARGKIAAMSQALAERGVSVTVDPDAGDLIAGQAHADGDGERALVRRFRTMVEDRVLEAMPAAALALKTDGGQISVEAGPRP